MTTHQNAKSFIKLITILAIVSMSVANNPYIQMSPSRIQMNKMNFDALDLDVAADGTVMAIGKADGKLYKLNDGVFEVLAGDKDMPRFSRVALDDDATPYVVTECGGQAFYLDCRDNWVALPGCVKDIGAGKYGDIWAIGCDERVGGFGVWKLFCKCDCKYSSTTRHCTRQRPLKFASKESEESRRCHWARTEGAGTRVAVDPQGLPWVVADNHQVCNYDGVNWKCNDGYTAQDVTVSNEGVVFASGKDGVTIGRLVSGELSSWQSLSHSSVNVAAGPLSMIHSVAPDNKVHSSVNRF